MARWTAVSTSTAVADPAETPEHAAVRAAAERAAAAAPGVRSAGGPAVDAALRTMAAALRDRTATCWPRTRGRRRSASVEA